MSHVVVSTDLPGFERVRRGKVRDVYALDADRLLLVATDRLSAFDVVFDRGIPRKGEVLTGLAAHWFERTRGIVENHLISADGTGLPDSLAGLPELRGRATIGRRSDPLPVECVVRGYLEGSAWKEYRATGAVTGIRLPEGLRRRSRLDRPIFTPATKAESGHDENIPFERMVEIVGAEAAETARDAALRLFDFASAELDAKGIVLADTKFEFGRAGDRLLLIDEALTPDSSRFWVKGSVSEDGEPISYDKQYVRDYLETLAWDKTPPPPPLPDEVVARTTARYLEIYERIVGAPLPD